MGQSNLEIKHFIQLQKTCHHGGDLPHLILLFLMDMVQNKLFAHLLLLLKKLCSHNVSFLHPSVDLTEKIYMSAMKHKHVGNIVICIQTSLQYKKKTHKELCPALRLSHIMPCSVQSAMLCLQKAIVGLHRVVKCPLRFIECSNQCPTLPTYSYTEPRESHVYPHNSSSECVIEKQTLHNISGHVH